MNKIFFLVVFACLFSLAFVSAEKIVLFAMDDFQVWWLEDIQESIVQEHIDNSIPVTLGVIPSGIEDEWGAGERIIERIQRWDSYSFIEVAQHGYDHEDYLEGMSYNNQYSIIKKGNDLMKGISMSPKSFIPPFGSADLNTVNVLIALGFHTLYNPVEMSPAQNDNLLIIQNQILLCRDGDEGKNCIYKDYSTLKSEIDQKINQHGVALILYHMQDFNEGTDNNPVFDTDKADTLISLANQLKNDGYTLMTVEQYYQHLNSNPGVIDNDNDGYNSTADCNDNNKDIWQLLNGYIDSDRDNYGTGNLLQVCSGSNIPPGYSDNNLDCSDNNANIHPGASETSCNGIDNDCDTQIDEDYINVAANCGIGECKATGILQCVLGQEVNSCVPLLPQAEICNNLLDDDCDTAIDSGDLDCQEICGNGICREGETCSSCPSDCGQCPVSTLALYPNGKGYRTSWTNVQCSSGVNEWKCVSETTANSTDYLKDSGTSKETFAFSDTGLSGKQINSVTLFYYAMWNNYKSNSCFEAMLRIRGKDYLSGTQMCVGSSWQYVSHTYTKNPATNLPWTIAEVDALEAGMHSLNPDGGARISQVYAVVEYA